MGTLVADEYQEIARRHAELYGVVNGLVPKARWAIWYDARDRTPGWCRIDGITGKWGMVRSAEDALPTLFDEEHEAREAIDNKKRGSWDTDYMSPRQFEGW